MTQRMTASRPPTSIIADLTGGKPNGYYQVGFAQALARPLILVISDDETPPFAFDELPFVTYRDPLDLRRKLGQHIYDDVLTTRARPSRGDNAHKYGGHAFADPYRVTGRVRIDPDVEDEHLTFLANVRVDSGDPRRPLKGKVVFHLHNDFQYPTESLTASVGYAELVDIPTAETFTVGVELAQRGIQLELDLSRVPGSTAVFRSRE